MNKKYFLPRSIALLTVLLFCITCQSIFAQETKPFSLNESPLPAPTEPVNDYVGVLSEGTKLSLNQKIKDFKARTNPQVVLAVAIVKTTGDRAIFDYSLAVYRGWRIGTDKGDNPGALLFIAVDDRKYFTQISRDLEDELPDGLVGQLNRQHLVPALKESNYDKGVADTIDAYMKAIEAQQTGTATPTPEPVGKTTAQKKSRGFSLCSFVPCLIIIVIIMVIIFSRGKSGRDRNDRNRWGGGGFGGGAGDVLTNVAAGAILGSILGGGRSSGGDWGGGGGDWGGGGGGDWGGFGGGGDAGGGGAGGDW